MLREKLGNRKLSLAKLLKKMMEKVMVSIRTSLLDQWRLVKKMYHKIYFVDLVSNLYVPVIIKVV